MRRGIRRAIMAAGLVGLSRGALCRAGEVATVLFAQAQQGSGMSVTRTSGKSYVVEALVTVALFGLALWVICKSSRRV